MFKFCAALPHQLMRAAQHHNPAATMAVQPATLTERRVGRAAQMPGRSRLRNSRHRTWGCRNLCSRTANILFWLPKHRLLPHFNFVSSVAGKRISLVIHTFGNAWLTQP
jgi:hypothetical protein